MATRTDDCTPAARVTKSLLGYGVLAGVVYLLGSVIHGLLRPGFDFTRDSWSLLSLGPGGWIHITVFVLTGLMVAAAGVGFRRHARIAAGPALVVYGALLVVAGVALPDAPGGSFTVHGLLHLAAGGLGFIAFAVAAFSSARRFARQGARGWAAFSVVAGVLLLAGFVGIASGSTSPAVVLGFTAAVVLSWVWLAVVSVRLYREAHEAGRIPSPAVAASA
jgi:hypothetical membrane protein